MSVSADRNSEMKLKYMDISHYSDKIVIFGPQKPKVFDHSDAWAPPSAGLRSSYPPPHVIEPPRQRAWAGAPGAAHWDTSKKVLYPPPKWAVDVSLIFYFLIFKNLNIRN